MNVCLPCDELASHLSCIPAVCPVPPGIGSRPPPTTPTRVCGWEMDNCRTFASCLIPPTVSTVTCGLHFIPIISFIFCSTAPVQRGSAYINHTGAVTPTGAGEFTETPPASCPPPPFHVSVHAPSLQCHQEGRGMEGYNLSSLKHPARTGEYADHGIRYTGDAER